jgi:uncharacterized membrane protein YesL
MLVFSVLSLLVLVNAQGISDLPSCSLSCVTQTAPGAGCLLYVLTLFFAVTRLTQFEIELEGRTRHACAQNPPSSLQQ